MKSERFAKWIFNLPLIIFVIVLVAFPSIYTLVISFQDLSLANIGKPSFASIENYKTVFQDATFWSSLFFSMKYTFISLVFQMTFGFLLALLFNRYIPGKRFLLSIFLLPIMVAPSLMGIMYRILLNENIGIIPYVLSIFNVNVNLFEINSVVPLLITLDTVQWTPFVFLIIYSALQGVDNSLYEAAAIDGASKWKQTLSITIPILLPIITIVAFLRGIDAFRTFDLIYVLTAGGPGTTTTSVSIYLYKLAFKQGEYGVSAAASIVFIGILVFVLPFFVKRIIRT